MNRQALIVCFVMLAACQRAPAAATDKPQCSPDAKLVKSHDECLSWQNRGSDTAVDMQPDGSCRICSDIANSAG
jgi:hypothetical protein